MNYTPIQTAPIKNANGDVTHWEATTTIGPLPCKVINEKEKMAVLYLQGYIKDTLGKEAEFNDWKQTDDMFGANYKPTSEAKFEFKEYGYYVDKDGNGKIGVLPK
jgi:hypothetical protein